MKWIFFALIIGTFLQAAVNDTLLLGLDSLTSLQQKLVLWGISLILALILLAIHNQHKDKDPERDDVHWSSAPLAILVVFFANTAFDVTAQRDTLSETAAMSWAWFFLLSIPLSFCFACFFDITERPLYYHHIDSDEHV